MEQKKLQIWTLGTKPGFDRVYIGLKAERETGLAGPQTVNKARLQGR